MASWKLEGLCFGASEDDDLDGGANYNLEEVKMTAWAPMTSTKHDSGESGSRWH